MPEVRARITNGSELAGDGREIQEDGTKGIVGTQKIASVGVFANLAINQAKQVVSYAVSNIGNFEGDQIKQAQMQSTMEIVGDLTALGVGIATGPVGAVVAIAGLAIKTGMQVYSEYQTDKHNNIQYEYMLTRSGNAVLNGSRGTEN
jgi:hypothetical protein